MGSMKEIAEGEVYTTWRPGDDAHERGLIDDGVGRLRALPSLGARNSLRVRCGRTDRDRN